MGRTTKVGKPELKNRRNTGGRFTAGVSGNARGRPKGAKGKAAQLRSLFEPKQEALINKVIRMALRGNMKAMKICLERVVPALKPTSEPVKVALSGKTLTQKAESIFAAAVGGGLSSEVAKELMDLLAVRLKVEEFDELKSKVEELQRIVEEKGGFVE